MNNGSERNWCEMMRLHGSEDFENADTPLYFSRRLNEFGLKIMDGGASYISIFHCPFCGTSLPESQRERWFEELEKLGIDPWTDEIPEKYKTDAWYNTPNVGGLQSPPTFG